MGDSVVEHPLDSWIGREIDGRYRVLELLGEGGMGAVFVAEHLTLQKQVALKVVHPGQAGSQAAAARFAREAMVTSRIDHPNVISAIDYGTLADGSAYLAMQLVRGQTLTEIVDKERSLPWPRACEIAAQIADGLSAAREHAIVHRDLKPDNILIQRRPDGGELIKVLDFGVARFSRESLAPPSMEAARPMTRAGTVIGTPGYMSPEQIVGKSADHRSDLYALGVLIWECVVGRRLWDAEDLQALAEQQLTMTPPSLREATGDLTIPEELDNLVKALLARQAFDRPQDVNAVRDVLRDVLHLVPTRPRRHSQDLLQEITSDKGAAVRTTIAERVAAQTMVDEAAVEVDVDEEPAPRGPTTRRVTGASTPVTAEREQPSLVPRRSRFIFGVLGAGVIVAALVMTGQLELRATGDMQRITESIAPKVKPLMHSLATAAAEATAATTAPAPAVAPPSIPAGVAAALEVLATAEQRTDRVTAAESILTHVPAEAVPVYARGVARLQVAESCTDKLDRLKEVRGFGDMRVLPALHFLSQRKKTGCGKKQRHDCLGCLRAELAATIEELEAKSLQGATAKP